MSGFGAAASRTTGALSNFNWASLALPVALGAQSMSMSARAKAAIEEGAGEAKAYLYNAALEDERRAQIAKVGLDAERKHRRLTRIMMGESKARAAGSGLRLSGQALDILREDALQAELDAEQIRQNTKAEMRVAEMRAKIDRDSAKQAWKQGKINAKTTLLTGMAGMGQTIAGTL